MKRLVFYIKKISALTHQLKKFNSPFHKRRSRNRFVDITTNEYQLESEWFELAHPRIARSIVSIRFVQTRHSPIIHRAIELTANFHGGNLTQQPFCLDFSVSAACHEFRLSNYEDEPSASSSCLTLLSLSLVKVSFDLGIPLPRNVAACSSSRSCESPICTYLTLHTLFHELAMRAIPCLFV